MSLMENAQLAAKRDDPTQRTPDTGKFGQQLIRLIPGEAVAAFTGAIALCVAYDWGWEARWAVFGVALGLTPLWIFFNYWDTPSSEVKRTWPFKKKIPKWAIFMGCAGFVVWSVTVPETPFLQWHEWDLKFAPFVTFVGAILLAALNKGYVVWGESRPEKPLQAPG